ncbi:MAG: AAA family ATPase [Desulforhopalus sp.]|nr:AAA family ATPase [Desulforhopalus sp.]
MEIQQRTDNSLDIPSQAEIAMEDFYPGAGRGELLLRMKGAIGSGAPFMVLSGGDGSGKTMMCRMLERECSSTTVVLFPQTVESFEDVVRIIAHTMGLNPSTAEEGKTVDGTIAQIISHLANQPKGLLVIFDEAEDIYLATLERIRKMLDRLTAAGVNMQIIFSGRKTFLENCEQLSICDFRHTQDLHFELLPLTEEETADYLRQYAERMANPEKGKIFNDEVVRNIHGLAKGKFRVVKRLADESLRAQGDDTSFMALLESVQEEEGDDDGRKGAVMPTWKRFIPYLWWIGGALCTLVLAGFLFQPGENRHVKKPVPLPAVAGKKKMEPLVPVKETVQSSPVQPVVKAANLPAVQAAPPAHEAQGKQPEVVEQKTAKVSVEPVVVQPVSAAAPAVETAPAIVEKAGEVDAKKAEPAAVPNKVKSSLASQVKIPDLRQVPPLKAKPGGQQDSGAVTAKSPLKTEAQENSVTAGTLTVDQLYQKRLKAGSVWASGKKNDLFTVQLMVLTAKNAESNLKKMLAQTNYRQEAGKFFIFKKGGSSENMLVFYGEYPSLETARLAQNSLPQFLREHQPYAISVKGAIAKVGAK